MKLFSTAVLALSLTSADPATVGEVVERYSATSPSTSADKSVTVSCPSGSYVVGASGSVTGKRTAVTRVRPSVDLSSVEVRAAEFGAGTPKTWTVTARANCAPGSYTLVSQNGTGTVSVSCPAGTKALGVGGETGGAYLTGLRPQTSLTGAVVEATGSVTAHAICGSNPGLVLRSPGSSVVTTSTGSKSVSCQGNEKVISAGVDVAGSKAIIDDVLPADAAATVTGKSSETQQIRWSITPYAVCSL